MDSGDFPNESSVGGLLLETGGVSNQGYVWGTTRFSDLVQDTRMDITTGDSMPIALSNPVIQMLDRVPPTDRFSVIHQEEA